MKSPLLLGIDVGTSAIKVQVIDSSGSTRAEASRVCAYRKVAGNGSEFRPDDIWRLTAEAIEEALDKLEDRYSVVAIACVGVGESGVLVDSSGAVCCDSLAWYDPRPVAQMAELIDRYDPQELTRQSGLCLTPLAGLCKLMWMRDHHADALNRARHWLHMSDFIAYRLSGTAATDFSLAGRTLLLDLEDQCWDLARLRELSLPSHLMPPITDNGATIGTLSSAVAVQMGLSSTCRVANGGHDHLIGALACGLFSSDALMDSMGTAEAILLPVPSPIDDPRRAEWGVEQGMLRLDGEPLYFLGAGLNAASASINWFRQELADNQDFDDLSARADQVPVGSKGVLFLPYLRGMSAPHSEDGCHGAFLNIGTHIDLAQMFRAVLEGLAYDARKMAECLIALAGLETLPERILVTGGSSQNKLFVQIKADVCERHLNVVVAPQSVSLGAALLAGLSAGVFSNWHDAVDRAGAATESLTFNKPQASLYRTMFQERYLPSANGLHAMVEAAVIS